MFKDLASKYIKRNKKTTRIFVALTFCTVLVLAISLSLVSIINKNIESLDEQYSTIGVVEYLGENYPNVEDGVDPEIKNKTIEFNDLIKDTNCESFIETSNCFAYVDCEEAFNRQSVKDKAIADITIKASVFAKNVYYGYVNDVIYSSVNLPLIVYVDPKGIKLNYGERYLVSGSIRYDSSYKTIAIEPFAHAKYENDVGLYSINDKKVISDAKQAYKILGRSFNLCCTDNVADLYEFHQGYLSLEDGQMPEKGECLISSMVAEKINKKIGDKISLNIFNRESRLPIQMYEIDSECDYCLDFVISGLTQDVDDFIDNVYVNTDVKLSSYNSYTLGLLKIKNGTISEYENSLDIPSYYRINFYDQGYMVAKNSLENIYTIVRIVEIIGLVTGLIFLCIISYLMQKNQKDDLRNMVRLGTSKKGIYEYLAHYISRIVLITGFIASIIGLVLSNLLFKLLVKFMDIIGNDTSLLYSNSAAFLRKTFATVNYISIPLLILIPTVFALACLLVTIYLYNNSLRKKIKKTRKHLFKSRSHSLSGVFKYSYLSIIRGGFRSFIPIFMFVIFAVLFFRLPISIEDTKKELVEFNKSQTITGYLTDITGTKFSNTVVEQNQYLKLQKIIDSNITVTSRGTYNEIYVIKNDGTINGPGLRPQPSGGFGQESYYANMLRMNKFSLINDVYGASEFIYNKSPVIINWLDGFSNDSFSHNPLDENICVISNKLANKYDAELNDEILIELLFRGKSYNNIRYVKLKIVGIYMDDGINNTIYAPIDMLYIEDKQNVDDETHETVIVNRLSYFDHRVETRSYFIYPQKNNFSYQSATFVINGDELQDTKDTLYLNGYSEPNNAKAERVFVLFNDNTFLNSQRSIKQKITYMTYLFPLIYLACIVISFVIAYQAIKTKRNEILIMHNLGTKKLKIFSNIFFEQLILGLIGFVIAILINRYLNNTMLITYYLLGCVFIGYIMGGLISFIKNIKFNRKDQRSNL